MFALGEVSLLQALGWAVINSLWQMAMLWLVYQAVTFVFRKLDFHNRASIAMALLSIGFLWFLITFFSILVNPDTSGTAIITTGLAGLSAHETVIYWLQRAVPVASVMYLVMLLIPLLGFVRNYRYVQVLRSRDLTRADINWRLFVGNISATMGIRRKVQVWMSGLVTSPVTIGFLKPVILLPLASINHLTPQQVEAVLLHELSHIRRYDYLLNILIHFIRTILYFNPFVRLLARIIEREREKSCDEMVMRFQYDAHAYASALVMLERNQYTPHPLAMASGGTGSDLLHRVEKILGIRRKNGFSFTRFAGVLSGLLCIIVLNALILISNPRDESNSFAFQQFGNPFYLFLSKDEGATQARTVAEPKEIEVLLVSRDENGEVVLEDQERRFIVSVEEVPEPASLPRLMPASYQMEPEISMQFQGLSPVMVNASQWQKHLPDLSRAEEERVRATIEMTRRVLEEKEWKEMEKKMADAVTEKEKAEFRFMYQQELEKVNWKEMEEQLKIAYNQVNWAKVNAQLTTAMTEIRIDSLTMVFDKNLSELNKLESLILRNNGNIVTVIPDTDLNLKVIREHQAELRTQIERLHQLRERKIVNL